jgi:peptide chain release factor subunit 1
MFPKEYLNHLAATQPASFPMISLYLYTGPDEHGRTTFDKFVRKELPARAKAYPLRSRERESFEADCERIHRYLQNDLQSSTNGLAIFACAANSFFEAVQLEVPVEQQLFVSNEPHLYPLARVYDQYRRHAAVLIDTHSARLFAFELGEVLDQKGVFGPKVSRVSVGGWSQARYQRHIRNFHLHHAKEVVEALDKMVKEDEIEQIVLAGDEVIVPVFLDQLPVHLSEKVIAVIRLDIATPEDQVRSATLEVLRQEDTKRDIEKVEHLFNEYRSGGLGVVGASDTLGALDNGQVGELILSASRGEIRSDLKASSENQIELPDLLVNRAHQTSASVAFIEDPSLLAKVGGVGALLRYRV